MKLITLFILFSIVPTCLAKGGSIEDLYTSNNIDGSLIIESLDGKTKYQYNVRDDDSFIPASTFKIPNTLIILQEGLVKNQSEVIKWDGIKRDYKRWNQDQTLKTAFQYSCVWCYQRYASQVGDKKYREYLKKFDYGNLLTGDDVTTFWLNGELRVSVQDQIDFLRKVYFEDLPIQQKHVTTLKQVMLSKDNDGFKLRSKTGWSGESGWYIGYLEVEGEIWLFANHIKVSENADLKFREELVMGALMLLKIIQSRSFNS